MILLPTVLNNYYVIVTKIVLHKIFEIKLKCIHKSPNAISLIIIFLNYSV